MIPDGLLAATAKCVAMDFRVCHALHGLHVYASQGIFLGSLVWHCFVRCCQLRYLISVADMLQTEMQH